MAAQWSYIFHVSSISRDPHLLIIIYHGSQTNQKSVF